MATQPPPTSSRSPDSHLRMDSTRGGLPSAASIWLATTGRADMTWSGGVAAVAAGVPVLVPAAVAAYDIRAASDAELFRASARRA